MSFKVFAGGVVVVVVVELWLVVVLILLVQTFEVCGFWFLGSDKPCGPGGGT